MLVWLALLLVITSLLLVLPFALSPPAPGEGSSSNSAFECGFNPSGSIKSSFSLQFFTIMLLFVIFDVELVLLLGCIISTTSALLFSLIILFITGGLWLEWALGKVSWMS